MRLQALLLLLIPCCWAVAQPRVLQDEVFRADIHSVQLYRGTLQLVYPVLYLGEPDASLTLEFDLLGENAEEFYYAIQHCDANWQPSVLMPVEFYEGYAYDRIRSYVGAVQVKVPYMHYSCPVPVAGGSFKVSGNYIVKVYQGNDPTQVVLTRRFLVAEQSTVSLQPTLGYSQQIAGRFALQQVRFDLAPGELVVNDPNQDIQVQVLQNFRWDNATNMLKPNYVYPDHYSYAYNAQTDFGGGNEYRLVDLRSTRTYGQGVNKATLAADGWHVNLTKDKPRSQETYSTTYDLNGNFYLGLLDSSRNTTEIEPDYLRVRFTLSIPEPLEDGFDVYVFGAFTAWQALPECRMHYQPDVKAYVAELLLKEGIYNYSYATTMPGKNRPDEAFLEGDHYETENYYTVLVYYRRFGDRYDRLVGTKFINYDGLD